MPARVIRLTEQEAIEKANTYIEECNCRLRTMKEKSRHLDPNMPRYCCCMAIGMVKILSLLNLLPEEDYKKARENINEALDNFVEIPLLKQDKPEPSDEIPLENAGLSTRVHNCLKRADIKTLSEVSRLTKNDLLGMRRMGVHGVEEIEDTLRIFGLSLRGENTK